MHPDDRLLITLCWVLAGLIAGCSLVWGLLMALDAQLLLPLVGGLVLLAAIWVAYVGVICWIARRHEESKR